MVTLVAMSDEGSRVGAGRSTARPAPYVVRKLPHVTVLFWVLKILAVTLGETAGDELGITLGVGYLATALVLFTIFVVLLVFQVRASRFRRGCSGRWCWGRARSGPRSPTSSTTSVPRG